MRSFDASLGCLGIIGYRMLVLLGELFTTVGTVKYKKQNTAFNG